MKNDTSKWDYKKELDCLLFFAQRISELLFDYTLSTYKFPTLYSTSLCLEAIRIIDMIEKNKISEKSIIPIKEELKLRLPKDIIVNHIIGDTLQDYIKEFNSENLHETRLNIELLYNKIRPDIYLKTTQDILTELIIENKQKSKIDKLTTNFVTALIDCGYSQSFINLQVNIFFFRRGDLGNISSSDSIKDFFKLFPLKNQTFEVIVSGSNLFKNTTQALAGFDIEIISELPKKDELSAKEKSYLKRKDKNDILLKCSNIKALDSRTAKEKAESKINTVTKLFNFFHHKDFPYYSKYALIYNESKYQHTIGPKISAMHKCQDFYPNKAGEKLNNLIHNFGIDSSSFYKIDKAIELHGESIKSDFTESQLLQNWISFETLLVGYSKKTKIDQVLEGLIPSLKLSYLATLIKELQNDLYHWDKSKTEELLSSLNGETLTDKVAQLVCIESNKPIREKFYESLELFPLLKNRILKLKEIFTSPVSALEYLLEHEQRVIWQLKRIYRTRNQIVHLGYVSDFTEYLVENSHNYLDIFINQIIHMVINDRQIASLEQGLKEIKICQQRHEKILKEKKNEVFTSDNYVELIFGKGTFANTRYSQ